MTKTKTKNNMEQIRVRSFTPEIRKKDEESRTVTFVASDFSRDTAHTRINPNGWDLTRFNKNPIIGYNHDIYGGWSGNDVDKVIGKGNAYIERDELLVDITFEPASINPLAEKVYQKLLFGSLNAVSVGFIPGEGHWGEKDEAMGKDNATYYYDRGHQLLEISVVNIPANGNATRKEIEEEMTYLRSLAPKVEEPAPEPEPEPEDCSVENGNKLKLLKAAASAALMLNQ